MNTPLICHFLIGSPGAGKSTIAQKLANYDKNYVIVSTDKIRFELYGDESIQGKWEEIEPIVIKQIKDIVTRVSASQMLLTRGFRSIITR
ncbi:hypothetical protein DSM106972_047830 [Dulcicalothrix desertica PCC 7102]|uniref:UDP-N-acetylglucosamine kinase n=1 Tax=Dulcicalothrix desertica PCC 7102 TaxID=232991 RepID=A0A433VCX1_9CYAN|nr:AAA family ATPase [Dulcicalothrix desertica]RUT03869.1 hypothetical protein DSM106972_047830 [Dulcicalothrix desertica PCC 7102]TWH43720.1 AAA domain-containing protein [Dulcicalothrix desertica PCC 7102]